MTEKYTVVQFGENITSETLASFRRRLAAGLQGRPEHLVLDLTGVEYIYSFGISLLIKTKKILAPKKHRLFVISGSRKLGEIFERINLQKIIPLYPDRETFEFEFYKQLGGRTRRSKTRFFPISA
jgi:anti-anti-sigma factor